MTQLQQIERLATKLSKRGILTAVNTYPNRRKCIKVQAVALQCLTPAEAIVLMRALLAQTK